MGVVRNWDRLVLSDIGTEGRGGSDVEVEGEDVLDILEQVKGQIGVTGKGGEKLAARLSVEGLGIAQEFPDNHRVVWGRDNKVGNFADVADGVVNVPPTLALPTRI